MVRMNGMARSDNTPGELPFALSGGRLCLDFVNTVSWRGSDEPQELLTDYNTLVKWSRGAGILNPAEAADLRRQSRSEPERAEAVVEKARELREAFYRNVTAWSQRTPVRKTDLDVVNRALEQAPERFLHVLLFAGELVTIPVRQRK